VTLSLSVIICAHNPRRDYLAETLASLRAQDLEPTVPWELILVDNASAPPLADWVDLAWHPRARIVVEPRLGLTHARLRSFHESEGEILIYVDDDNVLDPDVLRLSLAALRSDPDLGAIGGKVIARYEAPPPPWFDGLGLDLACRDLGEATIYGAWEPGSGPRDYPACAPIGAGMAIRREAYADYVAAAETDAVRQGLGRKGADLSSGEDNDMVMTLLEIGWKVAYLPQLRLEHLIPARRLTADYLSQYAYSSNRTWVQVLGLHGIRPWGAIGAWSRGLRKARAYLRQRAWGSPAAYIRWRAACGLIDGRALLPRQARR
jgi:glycosyltransferase involved in cell wall biosynthesis